MLIPRNMSCCYSSPLFFSEIYLHNNNGIFAQFYNKCGEGHILVFTNGKDYIVTLERIEVDLVALEKKGPNKFNGPLNFNFFSLL